jgi:hypothetical protein
MAMYQWETDQEDFLVLSGEPIAIVEGQERPLRRWDSFTVRIFSQLGFGLTVLEPSLGPHANDKLPIDVKYSIGGT